MTVLVGLLGQPAMGSALRGDTEVEPVAVADGHPDAARLRGAHRARRTERIGRAGRVRRV